MYIYAQQKSLTQLDAIQIICLTRKIKMSVPNY